MSIFLDFFPFNTAKKREPYHSKMIKLELSPYFLRTAGLKWDLTSIQRVDMKKCFPCFSDYDRIYSWKSLRTRYYFRCHKNSKFIIEHMSRSGEHVKVRWTLSDRYNESSCSSIKVTMKVDSPLNELSLTDMHIFK